MLTLLIIIIAVPLMIGFIINAGALLAIGGLSKNAKRIAKYGVPPRPEPQKFFVFQPNLDGSITKRATGLGGR